MSDKKFNWLEFSNAIKDKLRFGDDLTEKSREIGVKYSALRRAVMGNGINVDSITPICRWLGKKFEDFVTLEAAPSPVDENCATAEERRGSPS